MPIEKETARLVQSVVKRSGSIELPAQGDSMFPLIQEGDTCRFRSCLPSSLKKGDIVLFCSSDEKLVAHRLSHTMSLNQQIRFFFKGDTNLGFDEPVSQNQIIGKLVFIQKENMKVRANNPLAYMWGKLIFLIPGLSGLLRSYLNQIQV